MHITLQRASRLYRLVRFLTQARKRPEILAELRLGLRTFYRELELLKRCGIKVSYKTKIYQLAPTTDAAEGRLPFPDPQLTFSEMAELARHPGPVAKRLAELLETVISPPEPKSRKKATKTAKANATAKPKTGNRK
jgi:predicted DNA-binding transcriptional regulator YafY